MTEELETTKQIAKAVQETGKAVQGVTELLGDVGSWMSGVMGTTVEDFIALVVGDRLRALRMRKQLEHLDNVRRKWEEILDRRGIDSVDPISPKHAIPAFEAIADESDETLQDLWARLLANAVDPNRDIDLQGILIETLKQFEPIDAMVFNCVSSLGQSQRNADGIVHAKDRRLRPSQIQVSLDRLEKLYCIARPSGEPYYRLMALGEELRYAVGGNG